MHLIEKINSWLIIGLLFSLSISTALGSIISLIIFTLWLLQANFKDQFLEIKSNRVAIASLMLFFIHIIGMLWSSDLDSAIDVLRKNWKFLMLPVFMIYVRKEFLRFYINAFLASIFLSEFISYLIWFDIIDPIFKATKYNPTVFMSHVVYNPLLAVAIYILAARVLFEEKTSKVKFSFGLFFLITMSTNMFITGGRSGHVMFFILLLVISFQYYKKDLLKVVVVFLISSLTIFSLAYSHSKIFKERTNLVIHNIENFDTNPNSSVAKRIHFAINGFNVFLANPLVGVGTGDLEYEMKKEHLKNSPSVQAPDNPHNNHIMIAVRFGILGLSIFYWLFYIQIKSSMKNENSEFKRLGLVIPIIFFIACLGESYLSLHVTALFYSVISGVIYKNFTKIT